jgi:hypothetical protein
MRFGLTENLYGPAQLEARRLPGKPVNLKLTITRFDMQVSVTILRVLGRNLNELRALELPWGRQDRMWVRTA